MIRFPAPVRKSV